MKIKTRLTIQFTLIVASILVLFSFAWYYFFENHREELFYMRLKDRALTIAHMIEDCDTSTVALSKIYNKITQVFSKERIALYNFKNESILIKNKHGNITVSSELLNNTRINRETRFTDNGNEAIAIPVNYKYFRNIIIVSAYDYYGYKVLYEMKVFLLVRLLIGMVIVIIAGRFYSGQALFPISNVIKQVGKITATQLDLRVEEGNKKDEIAQLAITFNKMLERLEAAFEMQKNFVTNASHELRTPLTAITGQIEVALLKKRDPSEYESILSSILDDIKSLNKLSNGLLDLAQSSMDISSVKFVAVRIDELLLQTEMEIIKRNPDYSIHIFFDELPEDVEKLTIAANEYLLKIAIINIIDNACKFSDNRKVAIQISFSDAYILLKFIDNGIGIPDEDIVKVFEPFYRGKNTKSRRGYGIGLPLAKRIVTLHKGKLDITSNLNTGTTVIIKLPNS